MLELTLEVGDGADADLILCEADVPGCFIPNSEGFGARFIAISDLGSLGATETLIKQLPADTYTVGAYFDGFDNYERSVMPID